MKCDLDSDCRNWYVNKVKEKNQPPHPIAAVVHAAHCQGHKYALHDTGNRHDQVPGVVSVEGVALTLGCIPRGSGDTHLDDAGLSAQPDFADSESRISATSSTMVFAGASFESAGCAFASFALASSAGFELPAPDCMDAGSDEAL